MARTVDRLTDLKVKREKLPGLYHDGGGLYLQVTSSGAKSWVLRYMLRGAAREMGLGPVALVSLSEARAKAVEARKLRLDGIDPIEHRNAKRAAQALDSAKGKTFRESVEAWHAAHANSWGSDKYRRQQQTLMTTYAIPDLGTLPVAAIDTELVLKAIEPIWKIKVVTARRVRDNIEAVLDYAKARGWRTGENPARWRGHLDDLLAKPKKLHAVEHFAALPYAELGAFMMLLRQQTGRDALALELLILTAARVGEIIGMEWSEIDLKNRTWTIPASRMKSGREHRAALSEAAVAVIEQVDGDDGLLFPKARDTGLAKLRERLGYGHITTHGFRATFRTWAAERTNFPRELAEVALAHVVGDETERSYQRGDLFEKRRQMMDAWAKFCSKPTVAGAVVPLHAVQQLPG